MFTALFGREIFKVYKGKKWVEEDTFP